jgi:hypothetical protein
MIEQAAERRCRAERTSKQQHRNEAAPQFRRIVGRHDQQRRDEDGTHGSQGDNVA